MNSQAKNLEKIIESIPFWKAEPMTVSELSKILGESKEDILKSAESLKIDLSGHGIELLINGEELVLVTSSESGSVIENLMREEINKDLSKAALETLSIILYKGPVKRSEIDYIRGVNSQFILRNLMIRGLVEKESNPSDERGFFYKASLDLLNFMGIKSVKEMPEYDKVRDDINQFMSTESKVEPVLINDK